jgi:hypothetical protein
MTFSAEVPAQWVTGDSIYGGDRRLRVWLEEQQRWFVLMQNLVREKVYARQVALYLKMSTYQPQQPFSDPFAKSGWWTLLEHATLDELAQRDLDELAEDLRLASDHHL